MEALEFIAIIVFSAGFGTLILAWLDMLWSGFTKLRHRKRETRMPERIRQLNRV